MKSFTLILALLAAVFVGCSSDAYAGGGGNVVRGGGDVFSFRAPVVRRSQDLVFNGTASSLSLPSSRSLLLSSGDDSASSSLLPWCSSPSPWLRSRDFFGVDR